MEPKTKKICLVPNCTRPAIGRGLCESDRTIAYKLVKLGRISWDELVKAGKAEPARTSSGATKWFLRKKENTNGTINSE